MEISPFARFINPLPRKQHPLAPTPCQILPIGIGRLNQGDLLRTPPTLKLLLTVNGERDMRKLFKIDQPVATISGSKAVNFLRLMLQDPLMDIAGHANVKLPGFAAQDINPASLHRGRNLTDPAQDGTLPGSFLPLVVRMTPLSFAVQPKR